MQKHFSPKRKVMISANVGHSKTRKQTAEEYTSEKKGISKKKASTVVKARLSLKQMTESF